MKIQSKILSGYLFVCVVFVTLLFGGYFIAIKTTDMFTSRVNQSLQAEELLDDLRFAAIRIVASSIEYAWLIKQEGRKAAFSEEAQLMKEGELAYQETVKRLPSMTLAEPGKGHAKEIMEEGDRILAMSHRFIAAAKAGAGMTEMLEIKEKFEEAEHNFIRTIEQAMEEEADLYASQRKRMEQVISRAFVAIGCLSFVMLVLSAGGGVAVSTRIAAPIQRLREAAEKLARGEQYIDVPRESADEVGDLADSFSLMALARGKAERKLEQQAAELAERNEELKSFAYVASHDLREPLVTMRGFSGELKSTLQNVDQALVTVLPVLDEQKRRLVVEAFQYEIPEAFQFIESSISQMESQIYSIQRLSQLGHLEIVPRPVDTAEIMDTLLQDFDDLLRAAGGEVRVGNLPVVPADRGVLFQIVGHILDNAIKYRHPARPLVITVDAEQGQAETLFHVRDNGRGIASDDVSRIFNMFRATGVGEKGRGMGLTYVKALVRRLGGRIWCVSDLDQGTSFSFTIPTGEHDQTAQNTQNP